MDTAKRRVLKAFNALFSEFMQKTVIEACPERAAELITAAQSFDAIKRTNPTILIKVWRAHIYEPYRDVIDRRDVQFIAEKNYATDVSAFPNAQEILAVIDALREPLRDMPAEHQARVMDSVHKLSQLSIIYS